MHTPTRIITLALLLSTIALADHGKWHGWKGQGNACKDADIQVLANGDDLSLLFQNVAINMPAGQIGDGAKDALKNCAFTINVTPPPGTYLAGFTQVFSGGMIKSKKSKAEIRISYAMGPVRKMARPIKWEQGREILPEDAMSVFTQEYNDRADRPLCRETLNYQLMFRLSAERPSIQEFVLGGLDSLDAKLKTRVSVRPEYKPCDAVSGHGHDDDDDHHHGNNGHGGGHGGGHDRDDDKDEHSGRGNNNASLANAAWIAGLYPQLLNRTIDPVGQAGWGEVLKRTGSRNQVVVGIAASPECFQVAGNSNAAWVSFLYQRLLKRNADPQGLQGWLLAMSRGLSRDKVVFGFLTSGEYRGI